MPTTYTSGSRIVTSVVMTTAARCQVPLLKTKIKQAFAFACLKCSKIQKDDEIMWSSKKSMTLVTVTSET